METRAIKAAHKLALNWHGDLEDTKRRVRSQLSHWTDFSEEEIDIAVRSLGGKQ